MKAWAQKSIHTKGFTIVELLIVVVVIAILAAITIVAYNGIQNQAIDARRANDLASIHKALLIYEAKNGGVRKTLGTGNYTGGNVYAGWDSSVSPQWLEFLRDDNGVMPIDPVNTMNASNNPPGSGNLNYYYYCYELGSGPLPATPNVVIGYHKSDGTAVQRNFGVAACLP